MKIYDWIADKLGGYCTPETVVLSIIYGYYENGKDCFYSYKTLAETAGTSVITMKRAVKKLREAGYIEVFKNNFTDTNLYTPDYRITEKWREEWLLKNGTN